MNGDVIENKEIVNNYYNNISYLIEKRKENVIKYNNHEMVELYYNIGRVINGLIEKYNLYASQNKIIKFYSEKLTYKFGEGYSVPNLKKMKKFY